MPYQWKLTIIYLDTNRNLRISVMKGERQILMKYIATAPGRIEVSGNHTDHQHGCVMAAAINLESRAEVELNGTDIINICSEGYSDTHVDINDLSVHEDEKNTTKALVRGVAAGFAELGAKLQGFDAHVTSSVLPGSGLSSSASFEVLIGTIINTLFNDSKADAVKIAQIGQYAENVYYGKPCGLMDQTACSVGNFISIDFKDPKNPVVEKLDFDFSKSEHSVVVIDTHADHADLTDEYAAITTELKKMCHVLGKEFTREVSEEEFYAHIPEIRENAGDRAVLRGIHILNENKRVKQQVKALKEGDFDTFLKLASESGKSSWRLLQNVIPAGYTNNQAVAVAMQLAWEFLGGRGAVRVNGGGFAGTILTFVPNDMLEDFVARMDAALGKGSCHILQIRAEGGTCESKDA